MNYRHRMTRLRDRVLSRQNPLQAPDRRHLYIKEPDGTYTPLTPTPTISEESTEEDEKANLTYPTRKFIVKLSQSYPRNQLERSNISFVVGGSMFLGQLEGQELECKLISPVRDKFTHWEFEIEQQFIGKSKQIGDLV